jgi:ABC-type transport system involved in multi-copper enzyme maturation permease subunit
VSALVLLFAALGLVLLQWPLRRLLRWLIGPLFTFETVRLARQGGTIWLRGVYALALLLALYASFPAYAEAHWRQVAVFAQDFSERFLVVQSVTVLFLVPLFFGGAISDEKEKRSLDFLLTSHLTAREIILGKYASRVLSLAGVIMAGLPVLALTALWGGVDLLLVSFVFAVTIMSLLSLGAVTMLWSVEFPRTVHAVIWSYVAVGVLSFCCFSPLAFLQPTGGLLGRASPDRVEVLGLYALFHGSITLIALAVAITQLRKRAQPMPSTIEFFRRPEELKDLQLPPPAPPPSVALTSWRPIGRDALLWKERQVGRLNEPFFEAMWLYFGGILATLAVPAFFSGLDHVRGWLASVYLGLLAVLTIGLCLGLLIDLAGAVTREREQRTLESLLALPEARGRVLWVKGLGALFRRGRWLIAIIALLVVGLLTGTLPMLTVGLVAALVAAHAVFVASLSLCVSVLARSTVRAYVTSLVAVTGLIVATGVTARFDRDDFDSLTRRSLASDALNPISAWFMASRPPLDTAQRARDAGAILFSTALYLAAGVALAGISHWHFRRLERYT